MPRPELQAGIQWSRCDMKGLIDVNALRHNPMRNEKSRYTT